MKTCRQLAMAMTLAFAVTGLSAAAEAKCVLAGGEGTGVVQDFASFMAKAALKNSIAGMGATAKGTAKVVCKTDSLITTCTARQRACK